KGNTLWDILPCAGEIPTMPAVASEAIEKFRLMIEQFRRRLRHESPLDVVSALIHQIGYHDDLVQQYKDPQEQRARWAAVEDVVNLLAGYEQRGKRPTLGGFLDEIAMGDRENEQDKEEQLSRNAVALMTLHSAKGLEFPQVYLVGMEEGLLPHRRSVEMEGAAIDEERRLCYVGITRARDRLTISLALSRLKWGKLRATEPSRFLFEITGQADRAKHRSDRAIAAKSRLTRNPTIPKRKL
ncbi:MAG TPA: 3'-5' exonuclease, partial [Pirellulales bacterium]|nr:3'-5' exonuclease [Pirellulales bacterium]